MRSKVICHGKIAVICRCPSPGRILNILGLPDDVMDITFSKLEFKDKICVGLVCKQWDELLKAGTGALRHWAVYYNLDRCVSKGSDPSRYCPTIST